MFHRHHWTEAKRTFNAPVVRSFSADTIPPDDLKRILYGMTIVELHCERCGDVSSREIPGAM